LGFFGKERTKAIDNFKSFHEIFSNEGCLDIEGRKKLADNDAIEINKKVCNVTHCIDLQTLEKDTKSKYLRLLKKEGLSTRQIARLTGISRVVVLKA